MQTKLEGEALRSRSFVTVCVLSVLHSVLQCWDTHSAGILVCSGVQKGLREELQVGAVLWLVCSGSCCRTGDTLSPSPLSGQRAGSPGTFTLSVDGSKGLWIFWLRRGFLGISRRAGEAEGFICTAFLEKERNAAVWNKFGNQDV